MGFLLLEIQQDGKKKIKNKEANKKSKYYVDDVVKAPDECFDLNDQGRCVALTAGFIPVKEGGAPRQET